MAKKVEAAEAVEVIVKRATYKKASQGLRGCISILDSATDLDDPNVYERTKHTFEKLWDMHCKECEARLYPGNPALG